MLYKVVVDERMFRWLMLGWATRLVRPRIGAWINVQAGDKLCVSSMGAHDAIVLRIVTVTYGAGLADTIDDSNYLRACPQASSADSARRSIANSLFDNRLLTEVREYVAIELVLPTYSGEERAASSLM